MKSITITEKDLLKAYPKVEGKDYKHTFSESGQLIDELAYSAARWTFCQLEEQDSEYQPKKPYSFDYETDLFSQTRTYKDLCNIAAQLGYKGELPSVLFMAKEAPNLQAGAFTALHTPEAWRNLLYLYIQKLEENGTEGISEAYNKELQNDIDNFYDDLHKVWLHGDRHDTGVIRKISEYFTSNGEGVYTPNPKNPEYRFIVDEDDIEKAESEGYNKNQLKKWLIDSIIESGKAREYKEKQEREKRKAERESVAAYKEKQEAERKAKLLAMTL